MDTPGIEPGAFRLQSGRTRYHCAMRPAEPSNKRMQYKNITSSPHTRLSTSTTTSYTYDYKWSLSTSTHLSIQIAALLSQIHPAANTSPPLSTLSACCYCHTQLRDLVVVNAARRVSSACLFRPSRMWLKNKASACFVQDH